MTSKKASNSQDWDVDNITKYERKSASCLNLEKCRGSYKNQIPFKKISKLWPKEAPTNSDKKQNSSNKKNCCQQQQNLINNISNLKNQKLLFTNPMICFSLEKNNLNQQNHIETKTTMAVEKTSNKKKKTSNLNSNINTDASTKRSYTTRNEIFQNNKMDHGQQKVQGDFSKDITYGKLTSYPTQQKFNQPTVSNRFSNSTTCFHTKNNEYNLIRNESTTDVINLQENLKPKKSSKPSLNKPVINKISNKENKPSTLFPVSNQQTSDPYCKRTSVNGNHNKMSYKKLLSKNNSVVSSTFRGAFTSSTNNPINATTRVLNPTDNNYTKNNLRSKREKKNPYRYALRQSNSFSRNEFSSNTNINFSSSGLMMNHNFLSNKNLNQYEGDFDHGCDFLENGQRKMEKDDYEIRHYDTLKSELFKKKEILELNKQHSYNIKSENQEPENVGDTEIHPENIENVNNNHSFLTIPNTSNFFRKSEIEEQIINSGGSGACGELINSSSCLNKQAANI